MPTATTLSTQTFLLGGDLPVHRLGFGTMRLVGEGAWGEPKSRPEATAVLRHAVELGITLIDTADAYGPHLAEELIAEALHPYAADLVIATKGGLTRTGPAKSRPLGRPDYLTQSVELSLRRLKLDAIPLYQLHRIDPAIPVAETLGALKDLQAAGKIRHIGLSEVDAGQIEEAGKTVPIVSIQNKYSLAERKHEATLDYCTAHTIAFLPWYPLNAGKNAADLNAPGHPVGDFARERHLTPNQLALAWLLHRSPVLLPIPGTSSLTHLDENFAASSVTLSQDDWDNFNLILDTQAS